VCGSAQRSCAARLLAHSIAGAIENQESFPHTECVVPHTECVVLYNEVVQRCEPLPLCKDSKTNKFTY